MKRVQYVRRIAGMFAVLTVAVLSLSAASGGVVGGADATTAVTAVAPNDNSWG
jgi:hypothetical protein